MSAKINDLRSALALLETLPDQLIETDVEVGAMAERAEELGQKLPISISIGVDPAIEIGSCFEPPTTPLGYDELSVAGALRGEAVELCDCLTVKERAIANAEYVIEGEVIPGVRVQEDQNSHTGYAMPEFPGCRTSIAVPQAVENIWQSFSLRSCLPAMREDRDRRRFWHSPRFVS